MVEKFEVGKFYVFNKMPHISSEELWFNDDMENWYDGKPRKCIEVNDEVYASFEGIKGRFWTYYYAMKYFYIYNSLEYVQEEMEL